MSALVVCDKVDNLTMRFVFEIVVYDTFFRQPKSVRAWEVAQGKQLGCLSAHSKFSLITRENEPPALTRSR
jgi:hypothetical protein